MKIKIAKSEIVHFVGIGGIGMSGLAMIMSQLGFKIQGSDQFYNKNFEMLKKEKIKLYVGHSRKNISKATILIISSAIKNNNVEYQEAKKNKIPIYKRGEALANIVSLMKNIVVAGSHGKTTTTSLIASIFSAAKLDPTVINGGIINSLKSSARLGKSGWSILESDESDGSFVKVPATYSIITNIDREHMDFYKSMNNLFNEFKIFIEKTPSFGKSFICLDDLNNREIIKKIKVRNFLTYGENKKSNFQIKNIIQNPKYSFFDLLINVPGKNKKSINKIKIPLIGKHNIRNATAAFAVASSIGLSKKIIKKGLLNFTGVQRRFNELFKIRETLFFDDYAHHPTEIVEVLNSVKEVYKNKEIIVIFQPHRISRVNDLRREFSSSFKNCDSLVLCPIYSAGEKIKLKFDYKKFAKEIIKNSKVKLFMVRGEEDLYKFVNQSIYGNKVVIGMGAGSISNWMRNLKNKISN